MKLTSYILSFFLLLLSFACHAQNYSFKGKYGDKLALVCKNGKYGFVDKSNNLVIPCVYTDIAAGSNPKEYVWWSFKQYLSVCKDGKWGYIDENGTIIIPFIYDKVKNEWLNEDTNSMIAVCKDGKWGYIDENGTIFIPFIYDRVGISPINKDDSIIVVKKNGKWGGIGISGQTILPFIYDDLGVPWEGYPLRAKKNGHYGFINIKNEIIIPFVYSRVGEFRHKIINKYARVCKNGKWGYVDRLGREVIPLQYDEASDMRFGYALVGKNGKASIIDSNGTVVIPFEYNFEDYRVNYNYFLLKKNNKWGAIYIQSKEVIPFIYDRWGELSDSYFILEKDGEKYYFDYGGNSYSSESELKEKMDSVLATQGWSKAQYNIGEKYYKAKDYTNALFWLEKASVQGYKDADYYLGKIYYYGYGVEKDYKKALGYLLSSGSNDDSWSYYCVGWMYEHGQGVAKNTDTAIYYYNKALNLGYTNAQERIIALGGIKPNNPVTGTLPMLSLNSPQSTSTANYTIKIGVKSSSAISQCSVRVNGTLSRGVAPVKNDGFDYYIQQDVVLNEGGNKILVEVTNSAGTRSETYSVKYTKYTPQNSKPVLAWMSPIQSDNSIYNLLIAVKSSTKIVNCKLFINGVSKTETKAEPIDGNDYRISQNITLSQGENNIRVEVSNADGTTEIKKSVFYKVPVRIVQKRQALIIGNWEYHSNIFPKLNNPGNDARDIASKLRKLGFDVMERENLTLRDYCLIVDTFINKASSYDVSLFYYSGHAVEIDGKNYLVPIEVKKEDEDVRLLPIRCFNINNLLEGLERSNSPSNIIVLDACRTKPSSRGFGRGLAQMSGPNGTFIMYATGPGQSALDGSGRNSPFTDAFLQCLDIPNKPIGEFFNSVRKMVIKNTNHTQYPWQTSSMDGDFIFNESKN